MKALFLIISSLISIVATSQESLNVLIYYETNGFTHNSIGAGISMIETFGNTLNWTVADSESSAVFNTGNLNTIDVVVWLNTSGDGLLTGDEQDAFEAFIQNGGGFVGVHAATDTYRDGSWSWYNDLVGGIVQGNPPHTPNNTNATMTVLTDHPTTAHLGATWNKDEEYYYWELNGGFLFDGNSNLLEVESTGNNSYDAPRPVTWYKDFDGGRSFYTALGHNSSDYQSNADFITMMREAIIWAAGNSTLSIDSFSTTENNILIHPNPSQEVLHIRSQTPIKRIKIYSVQGKVVLIKSNENLNLINIQKLLSGVYFIEVNSNGKKALFKFVKK